MSDRNVILIGFMGSGKTAVGTSLAQVLGYKFTDTDDLIEQRTGRKIAQIFSEDGEDKFREIEGEVLKNLREFKRTVIAAGGGAPLKPENRTALRTAGVVISLIASPEEIYQRVKHESHRPLLGSGDLRTQIKKLLENRKGIYNDADHIIDTTSLTVGEVVDKCIDLLARDTRCDV